MMLDIVLTEYIPLQQGLRHTHFFLTKFIYSLTEYIPLQQGLRLLESSRSPKTAFHSAAHG